jgi:hypothetical protein
MGAFRTLTLRTVETATVVFGVLLGCLATWSAYSFGQPLPRVLDHPALYSLLVRLDAAPEAVAFAGALLSGFGLGLALRRRAIALVLLSAFGLLAAACTLVPLVLALLLGWLMGMGGGVPR